MRTLLFGVLLAVSSFGTAHAQSSTLLERESQIRFDLRAHQQARVRLELKIPSNEGDSRYRLPAENRTFTSKDSCVVENDWVMVTPLQECSHPALKRARPMLKFIYVF